MTDLPAPVEPSTLGGMITSLDGERARIERTLEYMPPDADVAARLRERLEAVSEEIRNLGLAGH